MVRGAEAEAAVEGEGGEEAVAVGEVRPLGLTVAEGDRVAPEVGDRDTEGEAVEVALGEPVAVDEPVGDSVPLLQALAEPVRAPLVVGEALAVAAGLALVLGEALGVTVAVRRPLPLPAMVALEVALALMLTRALVRDTVLEALRVGLCVGEAVPEPHCVAGALAVGEITGVTVAVPLPEMLPDTDRVEHPVLLRLLEAVGVGVMVGARPVEVPV